MAKAAFSGSLRLMATEKSLVRLKCSLEAAVDAVLHEDFETAERYCASALSCLVLLLAEEEDSSSQRAKMLLLFRAILRFVLIFSSLLLHMQRKISHTQSPCGCVTEVDEAYPTFRWARNINKLRRSVDFVFSSGDSLR